MLSCLFIAALWSPEGKGMTSQLLFVMFIVILLLSHLVSWDRCVCSLYRFLILAVFLTFTMYLNISWLFKNQRIRIHTFFTMLVNTCLFIFLLADRTAVHKIFNMFVHLISFFMSQSTTFQLYRDGTSWVKPVLSRD